MSYFLRLACLATIHSMIALGQGGSWNQPVTNPVSDDLNGVCFVDTKRGWAVGVNGNIITTTDGGIIWSLQYSEYSLILRDVFFIDSLRGWAVGRNDLAGYVARVFCTVNGGQTWFGRMTGVEDAVHFVSNDTGFVAGAGGAVRQSTDAGDTWTSVPTPATQRLRCISFVDRSCGWCAGDSGTILRTVNGGLTWSLSQTSTRANLRSVHFADVDNGWCVGADGAVLHSTDGGQTWTQQFSGTGASLYAVQALSNSAALAAGEGGLVLKTADAGATWRGQATGTTKTIQGLFSLTSQSVWAVGKGGSVLWTTDGGGTANLGAPIPVSPADGATNIPTSPTLVWRKTPGASSYTAQIAVDRAFTRSLQQKENLPDTLSVLSGLIGDSAYYWRVGSLYGTGPRFWSVPLAFRTATSVPTAPVTVRPANEPMVPTTVQLVWRKTRLATRYRIQLSDNASFYAPLIDKDSVTDTIFVVTGLQNSSLDRTKYYFWHISALNDAGESAFSTMASFKTEFAEWKRVDYDAFPTGPTAVYFRSPQDGFVGTSGRGMFRTTDGGASWRGDTLPSSPATSSYSVSSLTFMDSLVGLYATDYCDIFKTTDGGIRWAHRTSSSTGWFQATVSAVTPTTAIAQIHTTAISRTTDAGETWTSLFQEPSGNNIAAVHFVDSLRGWIVVGGGSKIVRRTTDGGLTWDSVKTAAPISLRSIAAVGPDTVFIAGNSGYLARSTDGGRTWELKNSGIPSSSYLSSLAAFDSKTLLAGGGNGCIYWSTSAGETWTNCHNLGNGIAALRFASRNVAFALMSSSALLKTTTACGSITTVEFEIPSAERTPAGFELFQNYPNPGNSSSTIEYALPTPSFVRITVFNALGQVHTTLVSAHKDPGYHNVRFDGSGLASGVYFYRLQAGKFAATKKLILLR